MQWVSLWTCRMSTSEALRILSTCATSRIAAAYDAELLRGSSFGAFCGFGGGEPVGVLEAALPRTLDPLERPVDHNTDAWLDSVSGDGEEDSVSGSSRVRAQHLLPISFWILRPGGENNTFARRHHLYRSDRRLRRFECHTMRWSHRDHPRVVPSHHHRSDAR